MPKYNWTYPSLFLIAREEGFAALYKGFVPKVLRLAPGGGVLLLVVEFTLGVARQSERLSILFVQVGTFAWVVGLMIVSSAGSSVCMMALYPIVATIQCRKYS